MNAGRKGIVFLALRHIIACVFVCDLLFASTFPAPFPSLLILSSCLVCSCLGQHVFLFGEEADGSILFWHRR